MSMRLHKEASPEQRQKRLDDKRVHEATQRSCETPEQRQKRLDDKRVHEATGRSCETPEQRQKRFGNADKQCQFCA